MTVRASSVHGMNSKKNVSPQHLGVRRTSKVPARLVETGCLSCTFSARLAVPLAGPSPPTCFSSPSRVCYLLQYETVCTVVLLPIDGAPRFQLGFHKSRVLPLGLSLNWCLGCPLAVLRPSLPPWSVAVCCGLAVLAGLLLHAPTTVMLFTYLVPTPPCTLWEPAWIWVCCNFLLLLWLVFTFIQQHTKRQSLPFAAWLKGDRPDNGDIEPSSDQPKKSRYLFGPQYCLLQTPANHMFCRA